MANHIALASLLLLGLMTIGGMSAPCQVRFGLGVPDLQKKLTLTDNNTAIDYLLTPDVTAYTNVSLGTHYYKLRIADVTVCLLTFTAVAGDAVTIVGAGGYHNRTVDFFTYPDNFTLSSQSCKIRFIHLGAGQGPVTVKVGGTSLYSTPLDYLDASDYADVDSSAGSLQFEVYDAASQNLVTSFELQMDPASVYTGWIQGLDGKYFGLATKDFPH